VAFFVASPARFKQTHSSSARILALFALKYGMMFIFDLLRTQQQLDVTNHDEAM
jgi:hypothetical protein